MMKMVKSKNEFSYGKGSFLIKFYSNGRLGQIRNVLTYDDKNNNTLLVIEAGTATNNTLGSAGINFTFNSIFEYVNTKIGEPTPDGTIKVAEENFYQFENYSELAHFICDNLEKFPELPKKINSLDKSTYPKRKIIKLNRAEKEQK